MISRPYFVVVTFLMYLSILSGCASTAKETSHQSYGLTGQASAKESNKVLIVNSNQSVERYQVAESIYIDSLKGVATTIINLESESQPIEQLQDVLNHSDYDVIYCIGAKALGSIDFIDPEIPVVYSAVLNWRRFQERTNYFGIASELSPQVQLTWFKYFFPDIKNIGVLYSEENQPKIEDAKKVSNNLSLNLHSHKLRSNDLLSLSAKTLLKEVEALWLISDSSVLSSIKGVDELFKLSEKLKVPVFSYNPLFMDMGAIMSLVADLPTTARQAALLTLKLLENDPPNQAIQYPAGSRIILDSHGASRYQMKLNVGALDSVDELQ